jgi:hypothetical protein
MVSPVFGTAEHIRNKPEAETPKNTKALESNESVKQKRKRELRRAPETPARPEKTEAETKGSKDP